MIECNLQKQKINERKFTMEKLFKLKEHGTDVKTEIIAGITTFLAMAYILAVNPSYLGGIDECQPERYSLQLQFQQV